MLPGFVNIHSVMDGGRTGGFWQAQALGGGNHQTRLGGVAETGAGVWIVRAIEYVTL
jgi:hypothetical protein